MIQIEKAFVRALGNAHWETDASLIATVTRNVPAARATNAIVLPCPRICRCLLTWHSPLKLILPRAQCLRTTAVLATRPRRPRYLSSGCCSSWVAVAEAKFPNGPSRIYRMSNNGGPTPLLQRAQCQRKVLGRQGHRRGEPVRI